ncbi:MAG TPA: S-layer homology domain-containing protein [Symbiobacteriaceae bacterium]|nr:S-layer homology domain-containing protein [Symbiobacteriaceae bacterium]
MIRRIIGAGIAVLMTLSLAAGAAQAADPVTEVAEPSPLAEPAKESPIPMPPRPGHEPQPLPEPRITSDQAREYLKAFFVLPAESDRVQLEFNLSSRGTTPVWDLNITISENNGSMGTTLATVDALTGRILQYSGLGFIPTPVRTGPLVGPRSEEDARARAWALVTKMAPERAANLREPEKAPGDMGPYQPFWGENGTADAYHFSWIEYRDGIAVPFSSISVGVHKQTLQYLSLHVNLVDEGLKFQAGPAKVTPEEAMKVWQAEVKPQLSYQAITNYFPFDPTPVSGYRLLYTFGELGRMVDATTGRWAEESNPYPRPAQPAVKPGEPQPVPAGNVKPVVPEALPLTPEAAQKLARTLLEIPADVSLRTEPSMFDEENQIRFHYGDRSGSASIQFDQKTGLIRGAWRHTPRPEPPPLNETEGQQVTPEMEEQARSAAIAVVQTYYSHVRDQLRLDSGLESWGPPNQPTGRFRFVRYVNDLPVPNDVVHVTIDLQTMKWRDINANWTSGITFPNPAGAVGAEKAREIFMADRKPVLVYRPIYQPMGDDPYRRGMPRIAEAQLVYALRPESGFYQVDALTGGGVGWDGHSMPDMAAAQKKVAGHWAEGELQFILSRQIIRPEQINPDAPLTRSQAAALLVVRSRDYYSSGPRSPQMPFTDLTPGSAGYAAVRVAWLQGWLRPLTDETTFRPDAPVTRAEFAVWAARALGLGELARSGIKVESEYTDLAGLTAEQRNAVTFLRAMGLLGPSQTYRGNDPLTQAEGAALTVRIYNYLLVK